MNVFNLRDRLVSDYRNYTRSFIKISNSQIKAFVNGSLDAEEFWPEPLLQLNPTFQPGGTIEELVEKEVLHPECERVFRLGETLERTTPEIEPDAPATLNAIRSAVASNEDPPNDYESFRCHPLASWIESTFGVREEADTGALVRQDPRRLQGERIADQPSAAAELAELVGTAAADCANALRKWLLAGAQLQAESSRFPIFAFRLHQFLTRGDTVWASLEPGARRHLELAKKTTKPGEADKPLFPLVFCRRCGTEYYRVRIVGNGQDQELLPRESHNEDGHDGGEDGYLHLSEDAPWPRGEGKTLLARLPDTFKETTAQGVERVLSNSRKDLPEPVFVDPAGRIVPEDEGAPGALIRRNFLFCLEPFCGVAYTRSQRSERFKLATLGVDNRSTATTILAVRALIEVQADGALPPEARKLLSFTDNRQDASLQAGHFNDFAQVALLRSAPPEPREEIIQTLLDVIRRQLAIKVDVLDRMKQRDLVESTKQRLFEGTVWHLNDERELTSAVVAWSRSRAGQARERGNYFVSSYSAYGQYLKRTLEPHLPKGKPFGRAETDTVIRFLFQALRRYGIVEQVRSGGNRGYEVGDPGYQINAAALRWLAGDGTARPVEHTRLLDEGGLPAEVNRYFVECYLYRAARRQRERHHAIIGDHSRPESERQHSKRLRGQAESQLKLLTEVEGAYRGDFYSYRYFATEGFLPGYNFPRLPVSAYVPARRRRSKGRDDEYISRPRFLAIAEFGPRALIYHEGARYRVHQANLDFGSAVGEDAHLLTTQTMKRCSRCGYAHPESTGPNLAEICNGCGNALDPSSRIDGLVQLQNVSVKLAQRITCDEEERQRLGYNLVTAYRFANVNGKLDRRDAQAHSNGAVVLKLRYGDAVDLWRVNLGWAHNTDTQPRGFDLDIETGYWSRNQADATDQDDAAAETLTMRVVPFVKDTKNALVMRFEPPRPLTETASLQAAFKQAIVQHFQLEPRELSCEPMPSPSDRQELFFYEVSEGGAGVLRQVAEVASVLPKLARLALEICHYDPDTLEDRATDKCGKACYECLLDYGNQPDHRHLDRSLIRDQLANLARAECRPAGGSGSRAERLAALRKRCDSRLEERWLDLLDELGLRLPSDAQYRIPTYAAQPDFFYQDAKAAIYIDGPPHDSPHQVRDDDAATTALIQLGYIVIRFHHRHDWQAIFRRHPDVFGAISE